MSDHILSKDDVVLALALVRGLDPDKYSKPEAKALIYRCKAMFDQANNGETGRIRIQGEGY